MTVNLSSVSYVHYEYIGLDLFFGDDNDDNQPVNISVSIVKLIDAKNS